MIEIDGSQGEGGGQVLRTSLALSLIARKPLRVFNIRAGRKRPGLRAQHVTCVRAAQAVGDATELSSEHAKRTRVESATTARIEGG